MKSWESNGRNNPPAMCLVCWVQPQAGALRANAPESGQFEAKSGDKLVS